MKHPIPLPRDRRPKMATPRSGPTDHQDGLGLILRNKGQVVGNYIVLVEWASAASGPSPSGRPELLHEVGRAVVSMREPLPTTARRALSSWALAGAGRAEEQHIDALGQPAVAGGQRVGLRLVDYGGRRW